MPLSIRPKRKLVAAGCTASVTLLVLAGCGRSYSPDTYATSAVQQANKAEQGTIIGVRQVRVSADGTTGAVTGGAAGGILGAQAPGGGVTTALGAVGGTLVGGLVGSATEKATGNTTAFEYIVRKGSNELVSVTQRDTVPLALGQKVLVIEGSQARVVPDYTVAPDADPLPRPTSATPDTAAGAATPRPDTAPPAVPPPVSATPLPAPPAQPAAPSASPAPALPLL